MCVCVFVCEYFSFRSLTPTHHPSIVYSLSTLDRGGRPVISPVILYQVSPSLLSLYRSSINFGHLAITFDRGSELNRFVPPGVVVATASAVVVDEGEVDEVISPLPPFLYLNASSSTDDDPSSSGSNLLLWLLFSAVDDTLFTIVVVVVVPVAVSEEFSPLSVGVAGTASGAATVPFPDTTRGRKVSQVLL